jgi:phospholipid transport system substrate-binding protein
MNVLRDWRKTGPAIGVAVALLSLALAAGQDAHASAEDAARAVVERLHRALVETAAMEPAPGLAARYAALAPVISETHDLATMGRITVRRHWRDWTDAERAEFSDVFARLSITTYASRFASIGRDAFEIVASEPVNDRRIEVRAIIRPKDGETHTLDYILDADGDDWRIVNIVADDTASELGLMASDYNDVLSNGDFSDLIATIEAEIRDYDR